MQTSNPERPRSLLRCSLLGIASVAVLSACTKFERDYVSEAFNDCMMYASSMEDKKRDGHLDTSAIIKDCSAFAQTLKVEN